MDDKIQIQPQTIIIKEDGTIQIDWANPAFSDVIYELYPKQKKEEIKEFCKDKDVKNYKIWCG